MDDIKDWKAAKTHILHIDGAPVAINTFPADIQFDVETFDRFKQEYLDLMYEQTKLRLALNAKLSEIHKKVKELAAKNQPKGNENDTKSD